MNALIKKTTGSLFNLIFRNLNLPPAKVSNQFTHTSVFQRMKLFERQTNPGPFSPRPIQEEVLRLTHSPHPSLPLARAS